MSIDTFIAYVTTPNWKDALLIYEIVVLLGFVIKLEQDIKGDK